MTNISKSVHFLGVMIMGVAMVSCAGTPFITPAEETQLAYHKIEEDSLVVRNAPDELKKAKEAVNKVKRASKNGEDAAVFERQLTLARQRIAIARKTAELHAAQDTVQRISDELDQLTAKVHKTVKVHNAEKERSQARMADNKIEKHVKSLKHFNARRTRRGLVLKFKDLTFNHGKAYLTSSAEQPVNELAELLDRYPKRNIRIEGYTDNTGPKSVNKKLSQQRADTVRQALISRGFAESRIQAVGFGEQYPVASNSTKQGRRQNRRVEIVISDKNGKFLKRQQ